MVKKKRAAANTGDKQMEKKHGLTSISGIATASLDDKFLLRTATFEDNSAAAGPPLLPNSLNLTSGCV